MSEQPKSAPKTTAKSRSEQEQEARDAASQTVPADQVPQEEGGAATREHVQGLIDTETERGYRGIAVDPTPRENYTLAGVTDRSKHTPEEFKVQTGKTVFPDVHEDAKK